MNRAKRIALGATGIALVLVIGIAYALYQRYFGASAPSKVVPIPAVAEEYGAPGGTTAYRTATAFLATLDAAQAERLVLPLDSPLRANWSNLPAGVLRFERSGLRIGDLTAQQAAALFAFLGAALSRHGYDTLAQVVTAEAVLADSSLARLMAWSADNYWIAFFGPPSAAGAWGWQFGGHHLAINGSFAEGRIASLSPTFVGIEPATYTFDGVAAGPLEDEFAAGLAVVNALPPALREEALLAEHPPEVVAGPGRDGVIPDLASGAVAKWPDEAQALLLETIGHWIRLRPNESANARLAEIAASLDAMRFGWHGETDGSGAVYFTVQGPSLILEFWTEGGVGSGDGHYHSIYRDPTNEYGQASR